MSGARGWRRAAARPVSPASTGRADRLRIHGAAFLRTTWVGMTGILLGLHLARRDLDPAEAGLIVSLGLVGAATGTALVGLLADRWGRRRTLVLLGVASAFGGAVVAIAGSFVVLAAGAFVGMVNGMGRDRGAAYSLEQAMLPATTPPERRTATYAVYTGILDAGHLVGALFAGAPALLRAAGLPEATSTEVVLAAASLLVLGGACLHGRLSEAVELRGRPPRRPLSPSSRPVVARFASISALDSLGGGFLSNALLSWWFFQRFGLDEGLVGPLFAAGRVMNVISYALAVRLARRIGLLRTMVVTHVPSSLLLLLLPFLPSASVAAAVYLLRELLVEMDLPTRQSYLAAVVADEDRTAATGAVNLARLSAWAVGPSLAGALVRGVALSTPLFLGAGLKIAYDLLLFTAFRSLRPPEEGGAGGASVRPPS